ncbi:MAG: Gfo/Idh/MocA family oxidoreductase [Bacteroidota bacterium]
MKVACVGAGYFAPFQLEAWQRLADTELVAICDLDLQKAQSLATKMSVPRSYTDYETMLEVEQLEILDVIVPPAQQFPIVAKALELGIHVICQKPFGQNLGEAERMIALAEKSSARLIIHENFRFQPWYRELKRQLEAGLLGEQIHQLYFRMRMGDGWAEDAYLDRQPYFRAMPRLLVLETGIHFIDSFRYLLGEVVEVYARLRRLNQNIKGEDSATILMRFASGAEAIWDASRFGESFSAANPRYTFGEAVIEGEKGALRLENSGQITFKALGQVPVSIAYEHQDRQFAGDCVFATQEHIFTALRNAQLAETEAKLYLQNLKIQEAIYQSAGENRAVLLS